MRNKTYWIKFVPEPKIFSTGTNPILLLDEIRELGDCLIIAKTSKIPQLNELDPEQCLLHWDIILTTSQEQNAIRDVFIFVEDNCKLKIDIVDAKGYINSDSYQLFQNILTQKGKLKKADINRVIKDNTPLEPLLLEKEDGPSETKETLTEQQKPVLSEDKPEKEKTNEKETKKTVSNVRVSSEKLDTLINLIGELVTVQTSLSEQAVNQNDSELLPIAEDVERLTRELRDVSMEIRLIPIGTLFNRFKRLVRDISQQQGKEIELILEGEETELDKTLIEQLNDPMVHLIRNSIDHGIEKSDIREKLGKNKKGQIHISATQSGADVVIEIKDDGKGIDPQVIRAKAVDKGLIPSDSQLSDSEILQLICAPGFSTAEKISNISGRGVGMDVVKRNIEGLRGSVDIKSQKGIGTTIVLKLPLTLGIIEGLLVKIAGNNYALPLSLVEDCMAFGEKNNGQRIIDVRGEIVPYIRLREQYEILEDPPPYEHIVITSVNDRKTGFVVDEIIGKHQIVIKTLGKMYKNIDGLSGATILGDGSVALILDVPKLIYLAEKGEAGLVVN